MSFNGQGCSYIPTTPRGYLLDDSNYCSQRAKQYTRSEVVGLDNWFKTRVHSERVEQDEKRKLAWWLAQKWDAVIVDESQLVKSIGREKPTSPPDLPLLDVGLVQAYSWPLLASFVAYHYDEFLNYFACSHASMNADHYHENEATSTITIDSTTSATAPLRLPLAILLRLIHRVTPIYTLGVDKLLNTFASTTSVKLEITHQLLPSLPTSLAYRISTTGFNNDASGVVDNRVDRRCLQLESSQYRGWLDRNGFHLESCEREQGKMHEYHDMSTYQYPGVASEPFPLVTNVTECPIIQVGQLELKYPVDSKVHSKVDYKCEPVKPILTRLKMRGVIHDQDIYLSEYDNGFHVTIFYGLGGKSPVLAQMFDHTFKRLVTNTSAVEHLGLYPLSRYGTYYYRTALSDYEIPLTDHHHHRNIVDQLLKSASTQQKDSEVTFIATLGKDNRVCASYHLSPNYNKRIGDSGDSNDSDEVAYLQFEGVGNYYANFVTGFHTFADFYRDFLRVLGPSISLADHQKLIDGIDQRLWLPSTSYNENLELPHFATLAKHRMREIANLNTRVSRLSYSQSWTISRSSSLISMLIDSKASSEKSMDKFGLNIATADEHLNVKVMEGREHHLCLIAHSKMQEASEVGSGRTRYIITCGQTRTLDLEINNSTGRYKILSGIVGVTMTEGGDLLVWKGARAEVQIDYRTHQFYSSNASGPSNACMVKMLIGRDEPIVQNIYQSYHDISHFTKFRSAKATTLELQQLRQPYNCIKERCTGFAHWEVACSTSRLGKPVMLTETDVKTDSKTASFIRLCCNKCAESAIGIDQSDGLGPVNVLHTKCVSQQTKPTVATSCVRGVDAVNYKPGVVAVANGDFSILPGDCTTNNNPGIYWCLGSAPIPDYLWSGLHRTSQPQP